jgi:hypothetical protein
LLVGLLDFSSTLKMEALCSSETSVATQRTTRRHIPEDDTLQNSSCFSHPSHMFNYKVSIGFVNNKLQFLYKRQKDEVFWTE